MGSLAASVAAEGGGRDGRQRSDGKGREAFTSRTARLGRPRRRRAVRGSDPGGHAPRRRSERDVDKVRAAALAAVPGGTIIRVETDSDGSPYEAHVRKSDGSIVTVKIDKDFKVTSTESGFGAGGPRSGQSNGTGA